MNSLKTIAAAVALMAAGACLAADTIAAPAATAAGPQASAPRLPPSLGLVEFLSLVRSYNPTLRAMPLLQGMDQADVRTASTWANPSVHYGRKPDEKEFGVEQPLPIFGQISLRTEAARLAAAAGQADRAAQTQDILSQAAQRFATLLVAQEKWAAKQQSMQQLEQAAKVVRGQIELGARSQYDGARVNLQLAQLQAQLEQQEAEVLAARSALAELLAQPHWAPQALGSLLPVQPASEEPTLESMWQSAQPLLAPLQAAHAKVVQAEQFTRQQAREALPTPTVGVSRVRGRADGSRYGYNQVGISVELPLFDRQLGAVARAQLAHDQALLEEDAAQQLAHQRLQQALSQRNLLRKTLQTYESRGLNQLAPLRQMAQDSYRLGQSSILEWLDAMGSVSEHQQEYLDLTLRVWQAQWELDAARGQFPLIGG